MLDLSLLWFVLLAGPLMVVSVVVLLGQLVVRLTRPRTPAGRVRWASRALTCLAVAGVGYHLGVRESRMLLWRGAAEICGVPGADFVAKDESLFPLRNVCVVRSGPAYDLVPWWVNPVVLVALAAGLACVAVAVRVEVDARRS